MQVGGQVLREQNLKRSNTPCISLIHTHVTDSLPARGDPHLGGHPASYPGTACKHNASCPSPPWAPCVSPSHPLTLHEFLMPAPTKERGATDSDLSPRGTEWGQQLRIPFLPFPNKDEGTQVVLVFISPPFSSILACLLRKGILKKGKRQKNGKKKKSNTHTCVCI